MKTRKIVKIALVLGMVFGLIAQPALATSGEVDNYGVAEAFGVEVGIPALKACGDKAESDTGEGVFCLLAIGLNILTYGVGILGTLGLIISGVMYATAGGNATQMTKAKSRIVQLVIGLVLYAVMYMLLSFLIPGGI